MKNFEKFEKEIKDLKYHFKVTEDNKVKSCDYDYYGDCKNCIFGSSMCITNHLQWLYEEYQEPLLTDEEKEYLKAFIKPFKDRVTRIYKDADKEYIDEQHLTILLSKTGDKVYGHVHGYETIKLPNFKRGEPMDFKGLQLSDGKHTKGYELKDLGLDD